MSPKSVCLGLCGIAVALAALFLLVGIPEPDQSDRYAELDADAKDRLAADAAAARIAAESRSLDATDAEPPTRSQEVVAAAPPGFVPAATTELRPTPPEGYSFTTHHEVRQAPLSDEDLDAEAPPAAPPAWMDAGERVVGEMAELAEAAGRDWTFGWIKLGADADLETLRAALAAHGGEALGQAGDLVRVRLPADPARLRTIVALDAVARMGAVPAEHKITDTLAERALSNIDDSVPVWITLMSDDRDGRWRNALKDLGAEVGRFDPAIRTYAATIPLGALRRISQADFVLAVESIGRVEPALEIAAPAMGADAVRSYDPGTGTFVGSGGASVPVGVMDTGLNVNHPDISSNRRSICGANFTNLFDAREEDQDLWFDFNDHGTHVTGIVLGNGAANRDRAGMAPLVQDIRFAKAVSSYGSASALGWNRAMDWFATPTDCVGDEPRKALVINSSLGVSSDEWEGRSVVERKIDAAVWSARQLFVTSAGNGFDVVSSSMAGAKNALSVGAAQNIGDIAAFSSQGPTYDGRLLPKIVGTGVSVAAARGHGATQGYVVFSGTSMSSPSVVGVAALVMDAVPQLREEPAALRARLMASAIKPDAFLGDASAFPLHNTDGPGTLNHVYGLGKVSARTAVLSHDAESGWTGGSTAFDVEPGNHAYVDIVVPEDASRLDVVMTWDEPPADTITSPVLHDLDLWVDWQASCGPIAACGQWHSRSRMDNVEWVIVPNPPAGVYRLKVRPNRIYGPPPRAGLAWTVIRGDSTPTLGVAVDTDRIVVAPGVPFEVEATISSNAYVTAGANLRVECRTEPGSTACDGLSYATDDSAVHREDGLERTLARDGATIVVGEIGPQEEQTVTLAFPGRPQGGFRLDLTASGWNAASSAASVAVDVGGASPPAPVQRPPNDDYDMAAVLEGTGGETTFDLVAATPDPGEPEYPFGLGHPRRERSLWYVWTAAETGLVRFAVAQSVPDSLDGPPGDYADNVVVQAFRDGPVASLDPMGRAQVGGGTTFFAERGETYRIRLSLEPAVLSDGLGRRAAMPELTLAWGPGDRPENDDYVLAATLEGASGAVNGNNQGATTEPGELIGNSNAETPLDPSGWAGSVWYRWTAPATGDYRFSASRRSTQVAAFVGDGIANARMVSGAPQRAPRSIVFPATQGVEYRIGVATGAAYWSGAPFELSWESGARANPGNDDFAAAAPTFGDVAFGFVAFDDTTVEHGEPAESGVRTAWWNWQASTDGRYTWLADRIGGFLRDEAPLQMSIFAGDDLSALEPVATDTGDGTMQLQTAFDAAAGSVYRVALGLPRDAAMTSIPPAPIIMQWGPTPENDDLANAAPLAGMSGSVTGSNEFATTERGEHTGTLGDSSLWWTFEPGESGWMRFVVDGPAGSKLAIYAVGAAGDLELVTVSRPLGETVASFRAEAGVRYVVRYGTYYWDAGGFGGARRGEFEIAWAPTAPPAMLRYAGSVVAGTIPADGVPVPPGPFGDQAFNSDGTELYVASAAGILVFARDPDTGALTMMDVLAVPVGPDAKLVWDEAGSALLVASCDVWLKYTPRDGGGIEHAGTIGGAPCAVERPLVAGDFVHNVTPPWMIETYRFDAAHDTLSLVDANMIPDVTTAVMTADSQHVYALSDDAGQQSLYAIERDAATGTLRISTIIAGGHDGDGPLVEDLFRVHAMAVHGSHLFLSAASADTVVFDLADRASPALLGTRGAFAGDGTECRLPVARSDIPAVDVVCTGGGRLFTVQAGPEGPPLATDLVFADGGSTDAFGNIVPRYDRPASAVGSPDGRHLYLAGAYSGIIFGDRIEFVSVDHLLVFERVFEADPAETPAE